MPKRFVFLITIGIIFAVFLFAPKTSALSSSDFNAGRVIDDGIFFNGNSISPDYIQAFLNAKVPVCDTYHSSSNPDYQPPFTCLKDFRQDTPAKGAEAGLCNAYPGGNKSAAEIIYEVGVSCGVSQRVLIVLLEKEQSLVTDTWPWSIQYRSATGYGCPDTAPCDAEYYGFFNQVYNAARQFKRYARDESLFRYRTYRTNYIQYNPNASCGGTNVYIENQATAGLYNYTPYQPNSGSLAYKLSGGRYYSTAYPDCGAYGNLNFWQIYNNWFGPTTNSEDYWVLVKHPVDGRYFIATNFAVHYVPSQQVMNDWGIGDMQPVTVTTEFITSRTYGSPLNRLLRDKYGNIFLMDGGKRHYVRDSKYLPLWQQDINSAITIHGLSTYVPDGDWLGYCAQSLTTPSNMWIMNGNKSLAINDTGLQSAWGCDGLQTTRLTDNFIASYPVDNGTASRYVISSTNKKFIADRGQFWTNSDQQIVEFYIPSGQVSTVLDQRLEQLIGVRNLTLFAQNVSTGQWFLVENGKRHYINTTRMADLWGITTLSPLSSPLLNNLTASTDLSAASRTATPNKYYIMDGQKKHYLPNQTVIDEWLRPGTSIDAYNNNFLDRYPEDYPINVAVGKNDALGAYFLAQSGGRLAIWNMNLYDSWGASTYVPVYNALYNYLIDLGAASYVARDNTAFYYLEASTRYPVSSSLSSSWALGQAVSILPQTLSRYTLSPTNMTPFVRVNNQVYSLYNLNKITLPLYISSSIPSNQISNLQRNYFSNGYSATHLLRSSTPSDSRLWLSTPSGKILLPTTAHAANMGYISKGVNLTVLPPEALDIIPTLSQPQSFLIQSPGGAFKLVSFGEGLGMPNGNVIDAYASITGSITTVSQDVFNIFPVSRYATRLIRDDSGKIYWLEGGKKRWILNGGLLNTVFNGILQTYLHSTVTTLIPDGTVIN